MLILWFEQLLLHKCNFPGKPGKARNKVSLQEQNVVTVLISFLVCLILAPLLDAFQGVHICTNPVIWTALITQMQFCRKTRKSQKQSFFSRIKVCYCSNIVSGLFDPTSTIMHFLGGLHLCTFCDLNSYYYTNAIFQENQEELETKFLCKNKRLLLF